MAEFEGIEEVIDECSEGLDAEAEEATEEALQEEIAEAQENVSKLGKVVDSLKSLEIPQILKSFTIFVAKNAAAGCIFFGTNVLLKKLVDHSTGAQAIELQKKQKKIKALSQVISDITNDSHSVAKWAKDKENVQVSVAKGITVPLPDLLSKFTLPMEQHVETAYQVAKQLMKKGEGGKTTFIVPTLEQVDQIIDSAAAITKTLQDIVTFVDEKKTDYPELGTLEIKQSDVNKLKDHIKNVKEMPYA